MDVNDLRPAAAGMMPEVLADLGELVRHPSVAFPGFPAAPVLAAAEATAALFRRAGVAAELLDIPGGYPAVWAELPGAAGRADGAALRPLRRAAGGRGAAWTSDPWALTERGGRWYGRGAADDKSGIAMHAAALRALRRPPAGGRQARRRGRRGDAEPPATSTWPQHPRALRGRRDDHRRHGQPRRSARRSSPLRCAVPSTCADRRSRTLDHGLHSGEFGGPAPDAMMALVRILDSLVRRPRRRRRARPAVSSEWPGAQYPTPPTSAGTPASSTASS